VPVLNDIVVRYFNRINLTAPDNKAAVAKTIVSNNIKSFVFSKFKYSPTNGKSVTDSGLVRTAKNGKIEPILTNSAIAASIISSINKK
jgi:hypothetical protein